MALGAQPGQVKSLFVKRGIQLAAARSVAGLVSATVLSRWVSSLLFGVAPLDPPNYLASALIVSTAALIASYIPARRASSVDTMESFRAD